MRPGADRPRARPTGRPSGPHLLFIVPHRPAGDACRPLARAGQPRYNETRERRERRVCRGDERAMPYAVECWEQSDLVEVVRLLDEASPVDRFQVDQVREAVFDDLDLDPALLLCVRVGGRIVGAAAALVRPPRGSGSGSGPVGFLKLLAVHPEMEGQGIGSALLAEAERRLADRQARAVRVFGDAPYYLRPGVDFRLTRLVCLLQRRGYTLR
ncbi:MAG: GNAT family N-acetyltransferase, partial [Chloroflexi bacterium]|nr:GNAT family N-acetyltransferase [Chloroflexota bacterium]